MTVSSPSLPEFRCKFTEFYRFLGIPRHSRSSYLRPCNPCVAFHTRFQPRIFPLLPLESRSRSSPRKEGRKEAEAGWILLVRLLEIFSHLAIRVFEWIRDRMKSFEGVDLRSGSTILKMLHHL